MADEDFIESKQAPLPGTPDDGMPVEDERVLAARARLAPPSMATVYDHFGHFGSALGGGQAVPMRSGRRNAGADARMGSGQGTLQIDDRPRIKLGEPPSEPFADGEPKKPNKPKLPAKFEAGKMYQVRLATGFELAPGLTLSADGSHTIEGAVAEKHRSAIYAAKEA